MAALVQGRKLRATAAAAVLAWMLPGSLAQAAPPNILFIMVDDLGYGDVAFTGPAEAAHLPGFTDDGAFDLPAIDALAASGVVLDQYYANHMCSPTRASLLTGRYNNRAGVHSVMGDPINQVDPSAPQLTEVMKQAGYNNGYFGKWHLGTRDWNNMPGGRGADRMIIRGLTTGCSNCFYDWMLCDDLSDYGFSTFHRNQLTRRFGSLCAIEALDHTRTVRSDLYGQFEADVYAQEIMDFVDEFGGCRRNQDAGECTPFFIQWHDFIPHYPLTEPPTNNLEGTAVDFTTCSGLVDERRQTYCRMMVYMEDAMGLVEAHLRDASLWGNTIVVFVSDNGGDPGVDGYTATYGQNLPFRGEKSGPFEGGLRVPAFVAGGGLPSALRLGDLHFPGVFHVSDWLPTLLAMAGRPELIPSGLDGIDQWSNLQALSGGRQETATVTSLVAGQLDGGMLRQGDLKLVVGPPNEDQFVKYDGSIVLNLQDREQVMLFDLAVDPYELSNLAQDPSYAEVVANMTWRLQEIAADIPGTYDDTVATPWPVSFVQTCADNLVQNSDGTFFLGHGPYEFNLHLDDPASGVTYATIASQLLATPEALGVGDQEAATALTLLVAVVALGLVLGCVLGVWGMQTYRRRKDDVRRALVPDVSASAMAQARPPDTRPAGHEEQPPAVPRGGTTTTAAGMSVSLEMTVDEGALAAVQREAEAEAPLEAGV